MSKPVWRAGSSTDLSSPTTTTAIALSFAHAGDFVVIGVKMSAAMTAVSSPSGAWTALTPLTGNAPQLFGKTVTTGDVAGVATLSWGTSARAVILAGAWSSCGGVGGVLVGAAALTTAVVTAPAFSSIWDESLAVAFGVVQASATSGSWTMASGWTSRQTGVDTSNTLLALLADQGSTSRSAGAPTAAAAFTSPQSGTTQAVTVLLAGSPLGMDVTASLTLDVALRETVAVDVDASRPQILTQIAFDQNPNSTGIPFWTTVSDRAVTASFSRGRDQELSQASPGSGQILLDNADGALEPTNTGSDFYPNVMPMRRLRVVVVWGGVLYPIWAGYITAFVQSWLGDKYAQMAASLTDPIGTLNASLLPVLAASMKSSDPVHLWPLNESLQQPAAGGSSVIWQFSDEGSSQLPVSMTYSLTGAASDEVVSTGASLPAQHNAGTPMRAADSSQGVQFKVPSTFNGSKFLAATATDGISLFPKNTQIITWEVFLSYDAGASTGPQTALSINDGTTEWMKITLDAAQVVISDGTNTTSYPPAIGYIIIPPGTGFDQFIAHQLVVTLDASGGGLLLTIVADGAAVIYRTPIVATLPTVDVMKLNIGGSSLDVTYETTSIHCLAMYQRYLGSAEIADHWAAYVGHPADLTGTRAARVFGWGGWDGSTSIDPGLSTMQPASGIGGSTTQTVVQQVADTEFGQLFVDCTGVLTVADRNRLADTTSVATFGDNSDEIGYEADLSFSHDLLAVFDRVQVARQGGAVAVVRTQATADKYLPKTLSRTIYSDTDTDAFSQATYLAAQYAEPLARTSTMTVDVTSLCAEDIANSTTKVATLLPLDIGAVVTVTRRGASTVTGDFRIEHIADTFQGMSWMRSFELSPVLDAPTW